MQNTVFKLFHHLVIKFIVLRTVDNASANRFIIPIISDCESATTTLTV